MVVLTNNSTTLHFSPKLISILVQYANQAPRRQTIIVQQIYYDIMVRHRHATTKMNEGSYKKNSKLGKICFLKCNLPKCIYKLNRHAFDYSSSLFHSFINNSYTNPFSYQDFQLNQKIYSKHHRIKITHKVFKNNYKQVH